MPDALKLVLAPSPPRPRASWSCFAATASNSGRRRRKALGPAIDLVTRAAKAERFTGKSGAALELSRAARAQGRAPGGDRRRQSRRPRAQGHSSSSAAAAMGKLPAGARRRHHLCRTAGRRHERASRRPIWRKALRLRAYAFDRYKTKRKDDDEHKPAKRSVDDRGRRCRGRAQGLRRARGGRRRRADWRATWSTSRPTSSIRRNSPAARRR